jgi:hypothetical protein
MLLPDPALRNWARRRMNLAALCNVRGGLVRGRFVGVAFATVIHTGCLAFTAGSGVGSQRASFGYPDSTGEQFLR